MSYVRMGSSGSQVYVYYGSGGGSDGYVCCMCALAKEEDDEGWVTVCETPWAMVEHLLEHVRYGHRVPYYVFTSLEDEYFDEEFKEEHEGRPSGKVFANEGNGFSVCESEDVLLVAMAEVDYEAACNEKAMEVVAAEIAKVYTEAGYPTSTEASLARSRYVQERSLLHARQRVERIELRLAYEKDCEARGEPEHEFPLGVGPLLIGMARDRALMKMMTNVRPSEEGSGDSTVDCDQPDGAV